MFTLTHAFKMFDKDQSNSIDKDEMRAVRNYTILNV